MLVASAVCSLLLWLPNLGAASLPPARAQARPAVAQSTVPVQLNFYGEALCPDCQAYVEKILAPLYDGNELTDLSSIVSLRFFGWGNAKNVSGTVVCQHGEQECVLNRALECAQRASPDSIVFFRFLLCAFGAALTEDKHTIVDRCSEEAGIEPDRVLDCADRPEGQALVESAGRATPPHSFVPWVTLNGAPLGTRCGETAQLVCEAFRGEKPLACDRRRWPRLACPGAPTALT